MSSQVSPCSPAECASSVDVRAATYLAEPVRLAACEARAQISSTLLLRLFLLLDSIGTAGMVLRLKYAEANICWRFDVDDDGGTHLSDVVLCFWFTKYLFCTITLARQKLRKVVAAAVVCRLLNHIVHGRRRWPTVFGEQRRSLHRGVTRPYVSCTTLHVCALHGGCCLFVLSSTHCSLAATRPSKLSGTLFCQGRNGRLVAVPGDVIVGDAVPLRGIR